jgi:hypothetical protein
LSGDVILKRWINFTGEDGTISGEEASAVVVVVVDVGAAISVGVGVVVVDAAAILVHKVRDGFSKRFIKLVSLFNSLWPAAQSEYRTLVATYLLLINPSAIEDDCQDQS